MSRLEVEVKTDKKHKVSTDDKEYIIKKIMEIKNRVGINVNIVFS